MKKTLIFALAFAGATAAWAASNTSAPSPYAGSAYHDTSFALTPAGDRAIGIALPAMDPRQVELAKRSNTASWNKKLVIGLNREVPGDALAHSRQLSWAPVAGGLAAQWSVTSAGAEALRIELAAASLPDGTQLRFAGSAAGTVYGPFTAAEVLRAGSYWSPVLQGDRALVEVLVPHGASAGDVDVSVAAVSHLFVNPADPLAEAQAKIGESQSCEIDLICRSATDASLASIGKAVARMTFSDGVGTYLCTGTLLNPTDGSFTPYFYSAAHCISTQSVANTLTTHWFYDRTACGTGGVSGSYVQLPGGATIRYANTGNDALLLQLAGTPPAGAVFAGWDANPVSGNGSPMVGVHHPAGDVKKVSLATFGGFLAGTSVNGSSGTSFIVSLWDSTATGVTEGGSSGSGIFTGSSAAGYKLRGGLYGGPSSCTSTGTALRDYYSRLDQVYPSMSQYLGAMLALETPQDLNGDNKSDILWRNTSSGLVYRMLMSGFTATAAAIVYNEPNTAWSIVATADFNGDGVTDLLWRNSSNGLVYLMTFNTGGVVSGGSVIYQEANASWKIVHTPDMNGDGKADILWWNSSTGQVYGMLMNGGTVTMAGMIYTEPNTNWRIEAVGDFDGNGTVNELLWRNIADGRVYMMTVTAAGSFSQTGAMFYQSLVPYRIIAAADYNGDGKHDILWRNDSTGQVYLQLMNGAAITTQGQIYHEPNTAWKIVAAGDYNGDGKADVLWRNETDGRVYMMLMNGMAVSSAQMVYQEPNTSWKILGPWELRVP